MHRRFIHVQFPQAEDEIDTLIRKLDNERRTKSLRVKEKTLLYLLSDKGISERKAAKILDISRRYLRELREKALDKVREGLEDED